MCQKREQIREHSKEWLGGRYATSGKKRLTGVGDSSNHNVYVKSSNFLVHTHFTQLKALYYECMLLGVLLYYFQSVWARAEHTRIR